MYFACEAQRRGKEWRINKITKSHPADRDLRQVTGEPSRVGSSSLFEWMSRRLGAVGRMTIKVKERESDEKSLTREGHGGEEGIFSCLVVIREE